MKKKWLVPLLFTMGCGPMQHVPLRTDPSQERLERTEQKSEQGNANAFIAEHPELDAATKKELRDGTITPAEALERGKQRPH